MRPSTSLLLLFVTQAFGLLYVFHQKYVVNEKHRILKELQTIPAFEMKFHIKRSSMQVHGISTFEAQVVPMLLERSNAEDHDEWSTMIRFQGIMNIGDHVYTFVDGFAYHHDLLTTKTNCLQASTILPIHQIFEAIQNAKVIDRIDTDQQESMEKCSSDHNLLQVVFHGEDYVLCRASGSDRAQGFQIIGADVDIHVDYLDTTVDIPSYHTLVDSKTCGQPVPDTVVSEQVSLLNALTRSSFNDWYEAVKTPLTEQRTMRLEDAQCGCKGQKKACIFFHGVDTIPNDGLKDDFQAHWGKIKQHAPCCSSIKFAYLDTTNNAWDQDFLQDKVCTYALSMSNSSDLVTKTIEDTIIVTHSMGNLMLGAAVVSGKCQIGQTTDWISLSGPLRGSMGSDFQKQICDGENVALDVLKAVVALFGQCPPSEANKSLPYETGKYCTDTKKELYEKVQQVHKTHTTALLCGESYVGLFSLTQIGLIMGGTILPHHSKANDGVVEFESCRGQFDPTAFEKTYKSRFYRAKLNHHDTTFRHGDGLFGEDNKPVKWFECLL